MSWARFDDHFDDDPDCDLVGEAGICLFLCSITWCSRNLTDGFVPAARARKLPGGSDPAVIAALVSPAARWWVPVEGGYQIRNYLKYNPSREEVEAERARKQQMHEQRVEAGRRGGQKSGVTRAGRNENMDLYVEEEPASPAAGADGQTNREANNAHAQPENEAKQLFASPFAQAKHEPPESRIPSPESRIPSPDFQQQPLLPPQQNPKQNAEQVAAADSLRFGGAVQSNGMTALRAALPMSPAVVTQNPLPLLVLSPSEADGRELIRALQDQGVCRQEAERLVAEATSPGTPFGFGDIRDQIAWLPHRNARNPGYWLPIYIRRGEAKPAEVARAERAARKKPPDKPQAATRQNTQERHEETRSAFLDRLTQHERQAISEQADAAVMGESFWREYAGRKGKDTPSYGTRLKAEIGRILDERIAATPDFPCGKSATETCRKKDE